MPIYGNGVCCEEANCIGMMLFVIPGEERQVVASPISLKKKHVLAFSEGVERKM